MPQPQKRQKTLDEFDLMDFAASIESLVSTIKSIGKVHGSLLTMNKAVVNYYQEVNNKLERVNSTISQENIVVDEQ